MNASKWDVNEDEYFADETHESNSRLAVFRESVPKYHGMFIDKSIEGGKQTKSMDLGSALHLALLLPNLYAETVVVGPDWNKNTNAYKEWKAQHADKLILDAKQEFQLQAMIAGITKNDKAVELLNTPGDKEQAIRWQDEQTEIWCKAKLDMLLVSSIIVDIKTCSEPNPVEFSRSCGQLDYECQAAFYIDGVREVTGMEPQFIHMAVGMSPPYECILYRLDDEALELGRQKNRSTLRRLRDCRDTDFWESPYNNRINTLGLPRWSFNRVPVSE